MYSVIIAGGVGKRFWPKSRQENPKQFLNIIDDNRSMLQVTYDRLSKITDNDKIYIVAGQHLKDKIINEIDDFSEENYISEPSGKNTAPCIGLAATVINSIDPDATMGVYPADHLIEDFKTFKDSVKNGQKAAIEKDALVTFGIEPNRPATGYGYIQFDENKKVADNVYKVKTFAEKPNQETAERFMESGNFLWNSGMFIWKAKSILKSIKSHLPELYQTLAKISKHKRGTVKYREVLQEEWKTIKDCSIDYGVMEKTNNVYVVKSSFDWSDVGSWDAVYELKDKDENNNLVQGDNIRLFDSEGCLVHSDGRLITTVGVDDLIIVQKDNATIIAKKGESQKIKKVVNRLKREDKDEYL